MKSRKITAIILWSLLILFVLRVIGQLAVLLFEPSFLPPFDFWESGLVPYAVLLTGQVLIIILYAKIGLDVTSGTGYFAITRKGFTRGTLIFAIIYFLVMCVRFLIYGLSIPVVFHWVLATFLYAFALHHRGLASSRERG